MIDIKIILNERKQAEKILKSGEVDKHPRKTISILAKYYLADGNTPKESEALIDLFLTENLKDYNPVLWYKEIDKIVLRNKNLLKKRIEAKKDLLVEVNRVPITRAELDRIKNLKSARLERLAFALLVYAKINNQMNKKDTYWVNAELKEICSDAKLKDGKPEQSKMIHKLVTLGYLDTSFKASSLSLRVLYADEASEPVIEIEKFDDFIYEYLKWNGENVGNCTDCGRLMKKDSNRQKRCLACRKLIKNKDINKKLEFYNH